jgi:hydrogenase/urease accessory protein HupE
MTKALVCVSLLALVGSASAHEMRPAYLEIEEIEPGRVRVLWKQPLAGELALPLQPRLPESWRELPGGRTSRTPDAAVVERFFDPGGSIEGARVSIDGLSASLTDALLRVSLLDGTRITHILKPASPEFVIPRLGSPSSLAGYLSLGVEHILLGFDHLLFVLGLLVIVGRRWMLMLKTVSSFTLAHSLTLGAATLGVLAVPAPPLNTVIALSILFLGIEIARQRRGETSFTIRHPWVAAFGFGLVHGLGFASGLSTLGLPKEEVVLSLFLFNIGVEVGQIGFVTLYLGMERSFETLEIALPRWAEAFPAYVVGTLGAYWTIAQAVLLVGAPR